LYSCRIFDRFGRLCDETDSNADTKANGNTNPSANSNTETFGHTNADTNPDPGCRNKSMSSSAGLWSHFLKHEYEFA
jgi:hypothetical protein